MLQYFSVLFWTYKWAPTSDNAYLDMWAQGRLWSAWAVTQSDQNLHCVHSGLPRMQVFYMWTRQTLIRLCGCAGWFESSLGSMFEGTFSHNVAQMLQKAWFVTEEMLIRLKIPWKAHSTDISVMFQINTSIIAHTNKPIHNPKLDAVFKHGTTVDKCGIYLFVCLCWGFTAQSTQWGHVEHGQFT